MHTHIFKFKANSINSTCIQKGQIVILLMRFEELTTMIVAIVLKLANGVQSLRNRVLKLLESLNGLGFTKKIIEFESNCSNLIRFGHGFGQN